MLDQLASLSAFHFMRPVWLLALLPVAGGVWIMWTHQRATDPEAAHLIERHLLDHLLVKPDESTLSSLWSAGGLSVAIALIVILVLAGPSWERRPSPFDEDRSAMVVVLSLSTSMMQTDIQPTRLDRAKQKTIDLLGLRAGSRTGIVVFAGTAHIGVPFTDDPTIVQPFLEALSPDVMPVEGAVADDGLTLAEQMLNETGFRGTILLMADDVSESAAQVASDISQRTDHQLLVLGVGNAAETVEHPFGEARLRRVAALGAGTYHALTLDARDVTRINNLAIRHFQVVDETLTPWIDAGYWLLIPLAIVFLASFRRGVSLRWVGIVAVVGVIGAPGQVQAEGWAWMDLFLTPDQQGARLLRQGKPGLAAERFDSLEWRAAAHYLDENFDQAADLYGRLGTAQGFFHMGNALAHGRHYVRARGAYEQVLRLDPTHEGALQNKAIIQEIIDDTNRMSEAQMSMEGERSRELEGEEPMLADGVRREDISREEDPQIFAERLLGDQEIQDMWLRNVQADPAYFLAAKFRVDLQKRFQQGDGK